MSRKDKIKDQQKPYFIFFSPVSGDGYLTVLLNLRPECAPAAGEWKRNLTTMETLGGQNHYLVKKIRIS